MGGILGPCQTEKDMTYLQNLARKLYEGSERLSPKQIGPRIGRNASEIRGWVKRFGWTRTPMQKSSELRPPPEDDEAPFICESCRINSTWNRLCSPCCILEIRRDLGIEKKKLKDGIRDSTAVRLAGSRLNRGSVIC